LSRPYLARPAILLVLRSLHNKLNIPRDMWVQTEKRGRKKKNK
jgi:hypothetical protein